MNESVQGTELVDQWRNNADKSNPAGPLFIGGEFTESDIVHETIVISGRCGTGCSGSQTRLCC
ncbi:hypothetical protein HUW63_35815 [Myxococcus sp. AM001]|uniref:DUF6229 family protein n=1 Tax=Myxococcus TaxID=32 RepID=UPI0013D28CFB|nr:MULTISPECIES: DUF6229 family protein [Myxococcus]NVJ10561.1 hypothetical protein [Myxococcus sp. AM001]WIG96843.1 hypothetical protein KGD87_05345 [Myxococcus sp. SDU36]